MTYIPKQPKQLRERVEAKLDQRLVRRLEQYCAYLESDRDYVLSQILELVFRKDKEFAAWLVAHPTESLAPVSRRRAASSELRPGGTA